MCGIAGFFNPSGIPQDISVLKNITKLLHHRGPDDEGFFIDENAALGHKRLSIIDLELGHQPMSDEAGEVYVVYNGEIYNYLDLRDILKNKGFRFKTKSDTEVLIYAYIYWGEDFIEKINGMFAFALYDKRKNLFLLFRDRIGVKPIYYTFFNDILIFASEPKSILNYPGFKKEVNIAAISGYLSTHQINLNDETLFKNIKILPPATYLKYSGDNKKLVQYWDIPINEYADNEEFFISELNNLLEDSTLMRLIADVPVGAYLSGGLDSSILISIISKKINDSLKTFCVGFEEEDFNEFNFASLITDKFNVMHKNFIFDENNYFSVLEKLIQVKDFPLNVPNEVLIFFLSKELKKDITVVLSGEGADELFGGYGLFLRSVHDYVKILISEYCPDFFSEEITTVQYENLKKIYKNIKLQSLEEFLYDIYSIFSWEDKEFLFQNDLFKNINKDELLLEEFQKILNNCQKPSLYDKFNYFLEKYHLPGLLLRLDNATMAASVEGRVPFTDHRLVSFGFNLPFKYKVKWKTTSNQIDAFILNASQISEKYDISKYILKKTYSSSLPKEIINRNKFSFPVPLNDWFSGKFNTLLIDNFYDKNSTFYDYFDYDNIINFISEPFYGKRGLKVWMLYCLKKWFDLKI